MQGLFLSYQGAAACFKNGRRIMYGEDDIFCMREIMEKERMDEHD